MFSIHSCMDAMKNGNNEVMDGTTKRKFKNRMLINNE